MFAEKIVEVPGTEMSLKIKWDASQIDELMSFFKTSADDPSWEPLIPFKNIYPLEQFAKSPEAMMAMPFADWWVEFVTDVTAAVLKLLNYKVPDGFTPEQWEEELVASINGLTWANGVLS